MGDPIQVEYTSIYGEQGDYESHFIKTPLTTQ
jgi:hypothetical protein